MKVEEIRGGGVRGYLHQTEGETGIVLGHGAGSDCRSPLLRTVAEGLASAGCKVLRVDLPFRQARPKGPPHAGDGARDREGLRAATQAMRSYGVRRLILGGHSYGGRQATILATEDISVADELLLFSYPLHPPGRPSQLRTAHFGGLRIPAVFVHGSRDPFGTLEEMREALRLIPAPTRLVAVEGAGHALAHFHPGLLQDPPLGWLAGRAR